MAQAGREGLLAGLRQQIGSLEGARSSQRPALPFAVPAIDRHLPQGGLILGALHEVADAGPQAEHAALSALFAASILARVPGSVLWCVRSRDLFAPALALVGLHPDRVVYAETWREGDVLPAMEEGLRTRGLAGVVGEVVRMSLTASRRLQLAAEGSGVTALVIRRWRRRSAPAEEEPTAALTRWQVSPAPSDALPVPGLARARWLIALTRARGAPSSSWIVVAPDAQGRLALPADLGHRPAAQERPRRRALG